MSEQTTKPSYLGLLNAIAVGESRGGELLSAWAKATPRADVRAVLDVVAIREREHGAAFTKRMCELGFSVREKPSDRFNADLACVRSGATDREKFEQILRYQEPARPDALRSLFDDQNIDPETGALLGRFIAEERDSENRLRACYAALCSETSPPRNEEPLLRDLVARLDRLTSTLAEIKALRTSA